MQFLIDTVTDSPAELRAAARMIIEAADARTIPYAVAAETQAALDALVDEMAPTAPTAPPPPPPVTFASVVGPDDPEVEIDDKGNVTALTTMVALAPPPPTPPPPGPAVSPELDSRGMPWDGRIHAANRAKKIDLSWKNKRGVTPELIAQCEAQNKPGNAPSVATSPLTAAAPASAAPAPTAPPPPALGANTTGSATSTAAGTTTPTVSVPPAPNSAASIPAAPGPIDFRGLMQKIQKATAEGKLSHDQVNTALQGVGLKPEEMGQLINNGPLIASVNAAIDKCLA